MWKASNQYETMWDRVKKRIKHLLLATLIKYQLGRDATVASREELIPHVIIHNWCIIQKSQSHRLRYVVLSFQIPENWHATLIGSCYIWFTAMIYYYSVKFQYIYDPIKRVKCNKRSTFRSIRKIWEHPRRNHDQPQKMDN